jgi:hypothetical protein
MKIYNFDNSKSFNFSAIGGKMKWRGKHCFCGIPLATCITRHS